MIKQKNDAELLSELTQSKRTLQKLRGNLDPESHYFRCFAIALVVSCEFPEYLTKPKERLKLVTPSIDATGRFLSKEEDFLTLHFGSLNMSKAIPLKEVVPFSFLFTLLINSNKSSSELEVLKELRKKVIGEIRNDQ